jgi:hypothetical protein
VIHASGPSQGSWPCTLGSDGEPIAITALGGILGNRFVGTTGVEVSAEPPSFGSTSISLREAPNCRYHKSSFEVSL